tara:strand:- start:4264 stop:4971 length:708 start_codon:yes stop_codon:yes gene_type:complete
MVKKEVQENKIIKKRSKKLTVKEKQKKQLIWVIVLMVSLVAIVILVPLIKTQFINKFVYSKLDFQKTQAGNMVFYSTRIPVGDLKGNVIGDFFINFRNDPRKLDKEISYKQTTTMPVFSRDETVYISTGEMNRNCIDGTAAVLTLSGFLKQFALMNISGAISDQKIAKETGFPFVTCLNSPDNTVINIIEGDETKIVQTSPDCYTLEFKDCEVMKVSEKFILEVIEGYMKGFTKR